MCCVDLELFAEPALQLEAILQAQSLMSVCVGEETEARVPTRAPVFCDAMIAEAQVAPLIIDVDREESGTSVA